MLKTDFTEKAIDEVYQQFMAHPSTPTKKKLHVIPNAVTPVDFPNSWNFGFKSVFICSLKTDFTFSRHSSITSLKAQNVS